MEVVVGILAFFLLVPSLSAFTAKLSGKNVGKYFASTLWQWPLAVYLLCIVDGAFNEGGGGGFLILSCIICAVWMAARPAYSA